MELLVPPNQSSLSGSNNFSELKPMKNHRLFKMLWVCSEQADGEHYPCYQKTSDRIHSTFSEWASNSCSDPKT